MTNSMAEQPGTAAHPARQKRALVEAVIASTVGTTIEWYDFFLYGTAAALMFPRLFFPQTSEFLGQICPSSPSRRGSWPGRWAT